MAVKRDGTLQELNSIFKSVGKRREGLHLFLERSFSGHFEFLRNSMLDYLSDTFSNDKTHLMFGLYGSMAERLNCDDLPNEVADSDIMIFPTPDKLMIHDEVIEYQVPEHPLHVRIKGINHPVFQSCLVEDTEYVATSALKNFHPSIYGELSGNFPHALQIVAQESSTLPFLSCDMKNSPTSPALTLNMAMSRSKCASFVVGSAGREAGKSLENSCRFSETMNKQIDEGEMLKSKEKQNDDQSETKEEQQSLTLKKELIAESQLGGKRISDCNKEDNESQAGSAIETLEHITSGSDFVPALKFPGWPNVAREWTKRKRKWPSPDIVRKVAQEGVHLVVKPPKNGGNPHCDFRISFSHAEYLLSQEMNDIQRECFRCLKKFHRVYLSTEPKGLVSFHLKNIFLQMIEETGAEMWTENNRAECMMKLFGNLLEALTKKYLPHFFVRSYNLFCADYIENPKIMESLARKVEQIIKNPVQFAKTLVQKQEPEDAEECIPSSEPTASANATRGGHGTSSPLRRQEHWIPPVLDATANQPENKERLKKQFFAISKKFIDMVSNHANCNLQALDPLERSILEDLGEIKRNDNRYFRKLPEIFERNWNSLFYTVTMYPEPNMRRRMLSVLKGEVKTMKLITKGDVCAQGDDEGPAVLMRRILDPTADDPFDRSYVLPGFERMRQWISNLPRTAQPQAFDLDDIPLD